MPSNLHWKRQAKESGRVLEADSALLLVGTGDDWRDTFSALADRHPETEFVVLADPEEVQRHLETAPETLPAAVRLKRGREVRRKEGFETVTDVEGLLAD